MFHCLVSSCFMTVKQVQWERSFTVSGVRVEDGRIGVRCGGGGGGVEWGGVERMGSGGVRCGGLWSEVRKGRVD